MTQTLQEYKQSPLAIWTAAFAVGICIGLKKPECATLFFNLTITCVFALIFLIHYKCFRSLLLIAFVLIGLLFGTSDSAVELSHVSKSIPENTVVSLTGTIDSIVSRKVSGRKVTQSFTLKCEAYRTKKSKLRNITGLVQVFSINAGRNLKTGDCVQATGMIRKPDKVLMPGQFDYGKYLTRSKISNTLMSIGRYAIHDGACRKKATFGILVEQIRSKIIARCAEIFDTDSSAIASALIVGYQKNIPQATRELYVKTGTAHLLAVSGLNITLIVSFFYYSMIQAGLVSVTFWNPIASIVCATFYCALAGMNPPVVRASLMIFTGSLGVLTRRDVNIGNLLWLSLLIALAAQPALIESPSLQLSYLAVFSLISYMPTISLIIFKAFGLDGNRDAPHQFARLLAAFLMQSIASTFITFIWLWPIIAHYFNTFSPSSFLANLIAAPIFLIANILTIFALALSSIDLTVGSFIGKVTSHLFTIAHKILGWISIVPFSFLHIQSPNKISLLLYYAGLGILFSFKRRKHLVLSAVGICFVLTSVLLYSYTSSAISKSQYSVFSFGKNVQCIARSNNESTHVILIRDRHISTSQIDWTLKPLLKSMGIDKIDQLTLYSSSKKDRLDWLKSFFNTFSVKSKDSSHARPIQAIPIYFRSGKSKERVQIGYEVRADGLLFINLIRINDAVLAFLEKSNLHPSILSLPKTADSTILKVRNIFKSTSVIIHHNANLEIPSNSPESPKMICIAEYPLINLRKSGSQLRIELVKADKRELTISQLPEIN